MLKDNIVFLREFLAEFQTTGTAFPTSRWAAEALTIPVRAAQTPQTILELGPGTGSVTTKILKEMRPQDKLTICEINPRFMDALKKKLNNNPDFQRHKDNVQFFLGPAQEIPEDRKHSLVVCALPFLNFDLNTVRDIFQKLENVTTENAVMTYYEYIGLRSLGKSSVAPPVMRKRIKELDGYFKEIFREHAMQRRRVWLNMLPINVYTLQFAA
ncbi:MAG: methyltransferase domain-containing protein [Deltaproteobacteria bacterium]|nr:methyltransferase domain-containing protein [Deltaproteobacteria bacterium]